MSQTRDKDQLIKDFNQKIGDPWGEIQYYIESEIFFTQKTWHFYRSVFGRNAETIGLLNSISGNATVIFEKCVYDAVCLHLGRLCDPPMHGRDGLKRSNCSLLALKPLYEKFSISDINDSLQEIRDAWRPIKAWRDRTVAHRDFAVTSGVETLRGPSRAKISEIIVLIQKHHNLFRKAVYDDELMWVDCSGEIAGFELLQCLYFGKLHSDHLFEQHMHNGRGGALAPSDHLPSWLTENADR